MTPPDPIVVVGASLAGGTAAVTLRDEGYEGRIVLVGDEPEPPYERPPLSKDFLRGERDFESFLVRPREVWDELGIELRLGAFVRGQAVLVALVALVLSACFWAIGLPYWLLVGSFAGIVEIVPVIGPLAAGIVAVGVGLSQSVHLALLAGLVVAGVRLLEDYVIVPRVLGHSVGLSPLIVLVAVTTTGLVLGGFAVILAVPLASILVTLIDVVVRDKDPAEEPAPSVLFRPRTSSRAPDSGGSCERVDDEHAVVLLSGVQVFAVEDIAPELRGALDDHRVPERDAVARMETHGSVDV